MELQELIFKRVLDLIDSKEPSDSCFSAKFKLSPMNIAHWRRHESFSALMKVLPLIAKEYGVTTDYLLGLDSPEPDMAEIPVIGCIHAGQPIETYPMTKEKIKLPVGIVSSASMFALDVHGDSMSPVIRDGDKVILTKALPRNINNLICAFRIGNEFTLKKAIKDSTSLHLIPLNPSFQILEFSAKECENIPVVCEGVVVQTVHDFYKP